MIPELGNFALMLAALVAVMQGMLPITGTLVRNPQTQITLQSLARPTAALQFVLVAFAFGALATSFLNNDFSVLYVSQHSNSLLPKPYQFAAVWGGHEGSLLLWVLLLSVWTVAVAVFSRSLPLDMVARVIGVLGLISVGFLPSRSGRRHRCPRGLHKARPRRLQRLKKGLGQGSCRPRLNHQA